MMRTLPHMTCRPTHALPMHGSEFGGNEPSEPLVGRDIRPDMVYESSEAHIQFHPAVATNYSHTWYTYSYGVHSPP